MKQQGVAERQRRIADALAGRLDRPHLSDAGIEHLVLDVGDLPVGAQPRQVDGHQPQEHIGWI